VAWPKEGFEDLFRDDFIMAAGWVLRRKLVRITTGPYQHALLRRGISKRVDVEDEDFRLATGNGVCWGCGDDIVG